MEWPKKFNEQKYCDDCGTNMSYWKWSDAKKKGWTPLCSPCITRSRHLFMKPRLNK